MEVILLVGVTGSGKTTFRKNIFPNHYPVSLDEIKDNDRIKEFKMLEKNLKKGKNIVADDTNLTKNVRFAFISRAKKYGAKVTCVFFNYPISRIRIQNSRREKKLPEHVLFKQKGMLERPSEDEGFDFIQILN